MQRETASDFLGDVALQAQLGYNQKPPKNPLQPNSSLNYAEKTGVS